MEIKDLCINNDLVDTFNIGFSDFILKIPYMTENQFIKRMIVENNTDTNYSSVCIHQNKTIGFSLVGIRNGYAMVNSFCVLKEFRGSNVAKLLMEDTFKKVGNKDIYLEVVKDNKRAVSFYKKMGFIEYKDAIYIAGYFIGKKRNNIGKTRFLSKDEIGHYQYLLDVPLAWNNNLFCIFEQNFKAIGYFEGNKLCAFIVYIEGVSINIKQLYVIREKRRQGIGSMLLYEAVRGRAFGYLFIKNEIGESFFDNVSKNKCIDSYLMKYPN